MSSGEGQSSIDEQFWDIVVNLAADDPRLVRALSKVILGLPLTVDADGEDDYGDMGTYLFHKYGLGRDNTVNRAMDICEARILDRVYGQ